MAYFIMLNEASSFKLDLQTFVTQLRHDWKDIAILNPSKNPYLTDNPYLVEWEIMINEEFPLTGELHEDAKTISLEDQSLEDIADFAVWYRKLVPAHEEVFIFHDSSDKQSKILENTTRAELLTLLYDE